MTAFVVPNSFYSEELTTAARQAARDAVKPIVRTYKAGETIAPAGEIITPADMEAFQQLGMISLGQRWEDMLGAAAIILLSAVLVPLYFYRRKRSAVVNDRAQYFGDRDHIYCFFGWRAFVYQSHTCPLWLSFASRRVIDHRFVRT